MFKQFFRVAFVALVWKQYKAIIISTILLIAYLLLVGSMHEDYVEIYKDADSANRGLSFVYKWAAYAVGVVLYFVFHFFRGLRPKKKSPEDKAKQANIDAVDDENDPFAAIRERDKLRSRADFLDGAE